MRRLDRQALPLATRRDLWRKKALSVDSTSARAEWKSFRASIAARPVVDALGAMGGGGQRCYYCGDSRGAEIDHFDPIDSNYAAAFRWANFMLACGPCNRQKSTKSPYEGETRALIDPTRDDPWAHLVYVSSTGLLAPRFNAAGSVDLLGDRTLTFLSVLNHDAIADGRRRAHRRLAVAAERALDTGDGPAARRDLLHAIEDDSYGLSRWFCGTTGSKQEPFSSLRIREAKLWRRFCSVSR